MGEVVGTACLGEKVVAVDSSRSLGMILGKSLALRGVARKMVSITITITSTSTSTHDQQTAQPISLLRHSERAIRAEESGECVSNYIGLVAYRKQIGIVARHCSSRFLAGRSE